MDSNITYTENINLKLCSGCQKMYTSELFNGKKTCIACRLSNKTHQAKLRTNQKRQREEEIKLTDYINVEYIEDLPEIIIDYITKFKENTQPNTNDIFKLKCLVNIMEFH